MSIFEIIGSIFTSLPSLPLTPEVGGALIICAAVGIGIKIIGV